ncbi:hypothetical protein [Phenylobacterium sp.]|uniref:hypothetical protein n=1 Tax=Phenylobacterium sp. TaxID=1871053 RepID=UPI002732D78A|nr:hypothetical protein [Phenylobacterium sp.]MDP3632303.1 hypothetical protein [Phenylobacterium sp.]MDP3867186.1 hypothetical protein [Phenylobacterium sp.]
MSVGEQALEPNEKIASIITAELLLRIACSMNKEFGADYNGFVVYLTILATSVGRVFRAEGYDPEVDPDLVGLVNVPGISRAGISRTTGIPKETVRRKVEDLMARGLVRESSRDGSLKPNFEPPAPNFTEHITRNTISIRRFGRELRRHAGMEL